MSVGGTNLPIMEPLPFQRIIISFNLTGPRLRYRVAVPTHGDHIVRSNGLFKPEEFNDVQIFTQHLRLELKKNKKICVDGGYANPRCLRKINVEESEKPRLAKVLSRHETVNCMPERSIILLGPFRHEISKQGICFLTIADTCRAIILYEKLSFSFWECNALYRNIIFLFILLHQLVPCFLIFLYISYDNITVIATSSRQLVL